MTSRYRWIGRRHDHGILLPRKFALLSDTKAKLVVEARARSTIITYQIYDVPDNYNDVARLETGFFVRRELINRGTWLVAVGGDRK